MTTTGVTAALVTLLPAPVSPGAAVSPVAAAPPVAASAPAPVVPAPAAFAAPAIPAAFRPADRVAAPAVETVPAVVETVSTPVVPVAASSTALSKALGKVGAPYRWGATGPNAFDCSGLVTWAYKGVGVSLPRTSRAMSQVGAPVAKANLQPGDLVFFYRPVSHVGIYIGNGKMVHASSRKSPVKISDISHMKFNSARRV